MKNLVEIEFDKLERETEAAILIRVDDKTYWLPKSVVDYREWSNIVGVPEWMAIEKGLV